MLDNGRKRIKMTPSPHNHLTHPKYRPDIDGLRAIAILSVVVFHAFPNWAHGGFIGVDIFFVISGYLISTIIMGSLERNSFSFVEFYIRRINRIFPALLLVLTACFVFGWFALLANEYKELGKHIAGGAGFIANFLYLGEIGYFNNAADTKPLLHLWSLGVEEQFYVIWPLLLWFAWKNKFNLLAITMVVAVISFGLNIAEVYGGHAETAFYSPQTRFWELLVGSVLAYMTLHRLSLPLKLKHWLDTRLGKVVYAQAPADATRNTLRNAQSLLGATLLVVGVVVITREGRFPGWWAVLPTLGSALIISAGAQAWFNRVLSNRVLVWFGLISFPLYLWHWPLLSFARIVESENPSPEIRIGVVLASIVLAQLTYGFIEKPVRFGKHGKVKAIFMVFLMLAIGLVGFNCYSRNGLSFRLKDRSEFVQHFDNSEPNYHYLKNVLHVEDAYNWRCGFWDYESYFNGKEIAEPRKAIDESCYQRNKEFDRAVFIWGDSHAQQLYFGLKNNIPKNWQILQVASAGGCKPSVRKQYPVKNFCEVSNSVAMEKITEVKPDVVVVGQQSKHNLASFNEIAEFLHGAGVKRVIFTGPTPHWSRGSLPQLIANRLWINTPERTFIGVSQNVLKYNAALSEAAKKQNLYVYADLIGALCNVDGCLLRTGPDKKNNITSYDYGHLTADGSDYVARHLLVNLITQEQEP